MQLSLPAKWRRSLQILAVLYLILLLTLTHWPRLGPLPEIPGKDKTLHFLAYAIATVLFLLGYLRTLRFWSILPIMTGLLVLGALDEKTQPWVNRSCDIRDWLADAGGILTAILLFLALMAVKRRCVFNQ